MAVSSQLSHPERDNHRVYLNQLYSLYYQGISWGDQLCDIGYTGYPDPIFEDGDTSYTPDFLSVGPNGDVQHIDVKGFEHIEQHFGGDEPKIKSKMKDIVSDLTRYRDIDDRMVLDYLNKQNRSMNITTHEIVALIPYQIYDDYKRCIESVVHDNNLILWLIKPNESCSVWKAIGKHSSDDLDRHVNGPMEVYPDGTDLIRFTRDTRTALKKFEFVKKLLNYCCRENKREFRFDAIDEVMVGTRPAMLEHLPKPERTEEWRRYMHTLLNRLDLVKHSDSVENSYIWKKKRFIRDSRDRGQILKNVRSELEID